MEAECQCIRSKRSGDGCGGDGCTTLSVLNATELYTLKWRVLCRLPYLMN